eukprot:gb/GEZN01000502.1/.p1 GENE.gb/GEZN01000502.1/~~gb/GEZN01000502.1/.p1  ORF type:complete len:1175 (+),score=207.56 gb/GEZN01000502.1/:107-3631(+)
MLLSKQPLDTVFSIQELDQLEYAFPNIQTLQDASLNQPLLGGQTPWEWLGFHKLGPLGEEGLKRQVIRALRMRCRSKQDYRVYVEHVGQMFGMSQSALLTCLERFGSRVQRLRLWKQNLKLRLDCVDQHPYYQQTAFAGAGYAVWIRQSVTFLHQSMLDASAELTVLEKEKRRMRAYSATTWCCPTRAASALTLLSHNKMSPVSPLPSPHALDATQFAAEEDDEVGEEVLVKEEAEEEEEKRKLVFEMNGSPDEKKKRNNSGRNLVRAHSKKQVTGEPKAHPLPRSPTVFRHLLSPKAQALTLWARNLVVLYRHLLLRAMKHTFSLEHSNQKDLMRVQTEQDGLETPAAVATFKPLSRVSWDILRTFGQVYGVGGIAQGLVYVDVLTRSLNKSSSYFLAVEKLILFLQEAFGKTAGTRTETGVFAQLVHRAFKWAARCLTEYHEVFWEQIDALSTWQLRLAKSQSFRGALYPASSSSEDPLEASAKLEVGGRYNFAAEDQGLTADVLFSESDTRLCKVTPPVRQCWNTFLTCWKCLSAFQRFSYKQAHGVWLEEASDAKQREQKQATELTDFLSRGLRKHLSRRYVRLRVEVLKSVDSKFQNSKQLLDMMELLKTEVQEEKEMVALFLDRTVFGDLLIKLIPLLYTELLWRDAKIYVVETFTSTEKMSTGTRGKVDRELLSVYADFVKFHMAMGPFEQTHATLETLKNWFVAPVQRWLQGMHQQENIMFIDISQLRSFVRLQVGKVSEMPLSRSAQEELAGILCTMAGTFISQNLSHDQESSAVWAELRARAAQNRLHLRNPKERSGYQKPLSLDLCNGLVSLWDCLLLCGAILADIVRDSPEQESSLPLQIEEAGPDYKQQSLVVPEGKHNTPAKQQQNKWGSRQRSHSAQSEIKKNLERELSHVSELELGSLEQGLGEELAQKVRYVREELTLAINAFITGMTVDLDSQITSVIQDSPRVEWQDDQVAQQLQLVIQYYIDHLSNFAKLGASKDLISECVEGILQSVDEVLDQLLRNQCGTKVEIKNFLHGPQLRRCMSVQRLFRERLLSTFEVSSSFQPVLYGPSALLEKVPALARFLDNNTQILLQQYEAHPDLKAALGMTTPAKQSLADLLGTEASNLGLSPRFLYELMVFRATEQGDSEAADFLKTHNNKPQPTGVSATTKHNSTFFGF